MVLLVWKSAMLNRSPITETPCHQSRLRWDKMGDEAEAVDNCEEVLAGGEASAGGDGGAPVKDPKYPIKVQYCPECTRPFEFCEYSEDYATCLQSMSDNMPELFKEMNLSLDMAKDVEKKKQKRGGKAQKEKQAKKTETSNSDKKIEIKVVVEGKRSKTRISGFHTFDIKVNEAKKTLAKKLGAGCTLEKDVIILQGDNVDYLVDNLPKFWPNIPADAIEEL
ncbi:density-regulated protein-like [Convolutriloba macropyga]|uniref:density-regulated protein-like n=1 Tax=Convolutriloba macropyga TaxID=536237 RepID=UPI003F51B070